MAKGKFDRLYNILYHSDVKDENPFAGRYSFPLGTTKPPFYYGDDIPERDVIMFQNPTPVYNDSTAIVFIGKQGTKKTRLIKRFVKYYYDMDYKIGVIDLKGWLDWPKVSRVPKASGLHPSEIPCSIPIVAGCPSFVIQKLSPDEKKFLKPMNLSMSEFVDRNVLASLGFAPAAVEVMRRLITKGLSPEKIENLVVNDSEIADSTKKNIMLHLGGMIEEGFFDQRSLLNIDKIWDDGKMWAIGLGNQDRGRMAAYTTVLMRKVHERAVRMKTSHKKERYLLIIDDTPLVAGKESFSVGTGSALQTIKDALSMWRSLGITVMLASQSPQLLHSDIYDLCKIYFIAKCGSVDSLRNYVFNVEALDKVMDLDYRPSLQLSEWIKVDENANTFEAFYPFNTPLNH